LIVIVWKMFTEDVERSLNVARPPLPWFTSTKW